MSKRSDIPEIEELKKTKPGTYSIDTGSGLIHPATQCTSPNKDDRPAGVEPDLVIIHGISLPPGSFGGPYVEALFTNNLNPAEHPYFQEIESLRVSSHLLIRRDGNIVQFVPFHCRAWHAGVSIFRGRDCCNDFSIGIELEGTDDVAYTDAQYDVLSSVLLAVMEAYPDITPFRIAGHCDVAPGRKSDPGPAFDWLRLYDAIGHPDRALQHA